MMHIALLHEYEFHRLLNLVIQAQEDGRVVFLGV